MNFNTILILIIAICLFVEFRYVEKKLSKIETRLMVIQLNQSHINAAIEECNDSFMLKKKKGMMPKGCGEKE